MYIFGGFRLINCVHMQHGVYFEITYSSLIMDAQTRRQMISSAKVEQHYSFFIKATLPNSKIAEWLSSISSGHAVDDYTSLFSIWTCYISCKTGDFSPHHVWKTFQNWSDCLYS